MESHELPEQEPIDLDPDHDPWQAIGVMVLIVIGLIAVLAAWKYW